MKVKACCRLISLIVLFVLLFSGAAGELRAQEKGSHPALSQQDLQDLVDLLENPARREALLQDLKQLMKARQAAGPPMEKKREEPAADAVRELFGEFQSLTGGVIHSAAGTVRLLERLPEAPRNIRSFFARPENRYKLLKLVAATIFSLLIAMIARLLVRRWSPRRAPEKRRFVRVLRGMVRLLLALVPYGVFLAVLFTVFGVFPTFDLGRTLLLVLLFLGILYRIVLIIGRELFSPEDPNTRLLNITDESANYIWIWLVRLANYGLFYFLVTRTLWIVELNAEAYSFIRGALLLVFPLLCTVLILQLAHETRVKCRNLPEPTPRKPSGFKKALAIAALYWPIPALAYVWAIFGFLIAGYEKGSAYLFESTLQTFLVFVGLVLALGVVAGAFSRLFIVGRKIEVRFPGLEARANRYIVVVQKVVRSVVIVIGLGLIAEVWGVPVVAFLSSPAGGTVVLRAIAIAITVAIVMVIIEISQFLSEYILSGRKKRSLKEPGQKIKTLMPMINTAVKISAVFVGGIVALEQLGVDTTPILAGAGILGLAVGFGSQTLVKDLINGMFFLFEESIRVGDVVMIGNQGGIVESVGLRTMRMRDLAGNLYVIPNSNIDSVMNMTKDYSRYVFEVGVAYREDVDQVMEVLKEIGRGMQEDPEYGKDIIEPLEIFGVDKFADSAVVIKARITTKPIRQWAVGREFNRRMKKTFDERGIEIPFPHRTLYIGEPKEGSAPPLQVQMQGEASNRERPKGDG
jgi:small-conductance mechanosensitive channel